MLSLSVPQSIQREREREYVLEVTSDKILTYNPRLAQSSNAMTEFEWRLDNIRRAKFHKNVGKVEVEVGRYVHI